PNLMDSAGRIVQEQLEENRRRYQGPRTGLPSGQEDPNFSTEEPTILSDTKGYDFGPYMNQVVNRVRYNWYSLIPEIARLGKKGRVVIVFTITQNGTIANPHVVANSGTDPLDRAAFGSITASNPFARLPAGFDVDPLGLQYRTLVELDGGKIIIVPKGARTQIDAGNIPIEFDNRTYRGKMEVFGNSRNTLTVVNELPLEEYLLGVVPNELNPVTFGQVEA